MSSAATSVLVLGIGNVLAGDDGVGVRVVEALQARAANGTLGLPRDVALVDGGTVGSDLVPWLAEARGAVVVDAALVGGAAGTIAVWRDEPLGGVAEAGLPGGSGLADLLATARLTGALPRAISLVGIQPGSVEVGDGLSAAVEAALPAAVEMAIVEARRVDVLSRRAPHAGASQATQIAGVTT